MKKNNGVFLKIILIVLLLAACILLADIFCVNLRKKSNDNEHMSFVFTTMTVPVKIGGTPIESYKISYGAGARKEAFELRDKIEKVSGVKLNVTPFKPDENYLYVSVEKGTDEISIDNGIVYITGSNAEECENQVNVFANTYLGYVFSGESREHIAENTEYINIPENVYSNPEGAWIEEREPIICLWKTDNARGIYPDGNVCLKSELLSYSDDQLYTYVKMMKYCGFSGIQVTDMCSSWAQYGGYEYVQDRIRFMADAAHSMDMKFTLWVWGAEFEGYGWVDDSVEYYRLPDEGARENPNALATFEKYYSIYAKLADCSDRVIMHFNDPGKLIGEDDIGYYANMFREKCVAVNPDINFGINCYTYQIEVENISPYIDSNYTVYSGIVHTAEEGSQVEAFRNCVINEEKEYGVWSWNLAEMEIDQLAEMNVNARIIADSYLATKEYDDLIKPTYWSEMDSYHIVNFFSLYASGNLLQDPYLDPDTLLWDASEAIVGSENAKDLYEALSIIQDARSGNGWKEFKNGYDEYILLSDSYPAESINIRVNAVIPKIEALIEADLKENTVPLPMSTSDMLSMILPHLVQIEEYSDFRMQLEKAEEMYEEGYSKEQLQAYAEMIYEPVHEYNTVVGSFGQPEARAQYELLERFCDKVGIETPKDPVFEYYRKQRLYGGMVEQQKMSKECVSFNTSTFYQMGMAFGEEETKRLTDELEEEGLVTKKYDGSVFLTDWRNYAYDF